MAATVAPQVSVDDTQKHGTGRPARSQHVRDRHPGFPAGRPLFPRARCNARVTRRWYRPPEACHFPQRFASLPRWRRPDANERQWAHRGICTGLFEG
jgi:hypothetical protein